MTASPTGLHHVTALATDPQRNLDFYVEALGLRLVKKTVNFDDPGTYHLYYGDEAGRLTDEKTREFIGKLLLGLADWTRRLRQDAP